MLDQRWGTPSTSVEGLPKGVSGLRAGVGLWTGVGGLDTVFGVSGGLCTGVGGLNDLDTGV